jgi:hypothetical protein
MFGAWDLCENELEWFEWFPCLMRLWQIILVIPSRKTMYERSFLKVNIIKNYDRSRISLETLDMLMFLSFNVPLVK